MQEVQQPQPLPIIAEPATDAACSPEIEVQAEEEVPFPEYYPVVLRCLHQRHPVRSLCLRIINWPWFERISMLVILINCITLGMYQPCVDELCLQPRCKVLYGFDHAVFAFFSWELMVKVTAMGIWGKLGYLGDSWNRLDFFIVLAGLLEYLPQTKDLSLTAIRTIRVLRPLRAINRIPSMRILVMLLLDTLPMLGNVLLLCFFVFFIFGIIGVQLWKGVLRNRCFLSINETILHPGLNLTDYYRLNTSVDNLVAAKDYICSAKDSGGIQSCDGINPTVMWLESGSYITCNQSANYFLDNLPSNSTCVNWNQYYSVCNASVSNPYMGSINFDNIGFAWVAIFQVISLESWVDIMYYIQDAHSFWSWIYFVSLIVIGSFFMINLCLVVIATQFSETKKREVEKMLQERNRCKSTSTLTTSSDPGSCYGQIVKLLVRQLRRVHRLLLQRYREFQGQRQTAGVVVGGRDGIVGSSEVQMVAHGDLSQRWHPPRASPEVSDFDDAASSGPQRPRLLDLPTSLARRASLDCALESAAMRVCGGEGGCGRRSSWNSCCSSSAAAGGSGRIQRLSVGYRESDLFPGTPGTVESESRRMSRGGRKLFVDFF